MLSDPAFIDRADIKQFIGLPPVQAVYWILLGCLRELMRSGVMRESVSRASSVNHIGARGLKVMNILQELLDWRRLKLHQNGFEDPDLDMRALKNSETLCNLAEICHVSSYSM